MLHMHACADSKCVHIHCIHCLVAFVGRFVGDSYILYILHVLPWQINVNNIAFAIHNMTVFTFHACMLWVTMPWQQPEHCKAFP